MPSSLMVDSNADPMETPRSASPSSKAFETPDRDPELKEAPGTTSAKAEDPTTMGPASAGKPNTVTPHESGTREDAKKSEVSPADDLLVGISPSQSSKQVRFDGDGNEAKPEHDGDTASTLAPTDSPASSMSSGSKRGFVSRRGGRYSSPSRAAPPVLEYKTYRSPARKKTDTVNIDNDTVPSLTSSSSGGLHSTSSPNRGDTERPLGEKFSDGDKANASDRPAPEEKGTAKPDAGGEDPAVSDSSRQTEPQSGGAGASTTGVEVVKKGKPTSITCDSSMIPSTSPLASHDVDGSPSTAVQRKQLVTSSSASAVATSIPPKTALKSDGGEATETRRNVTFSPPQPPRDGTLEKPRKSPTKSPGGQFQSLPSLQDAKLQSPCGIFLSPYSPSPSAYQTLQEVTSFERGESKQPEQAASGGAPTKPVSDEKAAKTRDQERERAVSTPTDFALDFGKGHELSASFDASNVLAWLQSPTAHGLFSPGGGFGSSANTPRGRYPQPRTPRTPTVGTSFFFSDVASLPRNGEFTSPKGQGGATDAGGAKRGGTGAQQGPLSSMICISPLASSKRGTQGGSASAQSGGGAQTDVPIQYKDVFASPRLPTPARGKPRNMPMIGESPSKGSKGRGRSNLDAVHMAERDLMEDEDLSVLLQLASHSNPSGQAGSGPHVFRASPRSRTKGQLDQRRGTYGNPGLQLPIIGGQGGDGAKSKLARKTAFREHADANDFTPPPLSIRSSSSGGSKEIYLGEATKSGSKNTASTTAGKSSKSKSKNGHAADTGKRSTGGASKGGTGAKKTTKKGVAPATTYAMPGSQMPYHPAQVTDPSMQYYPMHGAMPGLPPGGNMRVVVGGPPPSSRTGAGVSPRADKYTSSPHRPPPYTMSTSHGQHQSGAHVPPPGPYAHHPYAHPPPHMGGMGVPPPYHYPPHPHHMPMYASQHPQGTVKGVSKKPKSKSAKAAAKRTPDGKASTPVSKKQKRSPSKSAKRKQKASTTTGNPVDRQKAAAAIAAVNQASGGKNDRAAALAAAILRGVTMRPSGKWQAQLYYAGKSRYIGVFDTREKAALAYEIAREKLKSENKSPADQSAQGLKATEAAVNSARKAAFEGVNEKDPRLSSK